MILSNSYTKSEVLNKLSTYFKDNNCKNLYKDSCINYTGQTKDTKEYYSQVIIDYLVENIEEFKRQFENIIITREKNYKTFTHNGLSNFDFEKQISGERREEKIAHAMYCQYKDKPAVFGKILDYQVPLKNHATDFGIGKIDLLSYKPYKIDNSERIKLYILELKKDKSKESLLRCILEAYTYYKIVDRKKICADFSQDFDNCDFVIAPLVYKSDDFINQLNFVKPLINILDIPVELFTWEYISGEYKIEVHQSSKLYDGLIEIK